MKKSIFDFTDYRLYLSAAIADMPGGGRGFRSQMAEAMGCQRAFVSHVLQGDADLNLEHGDRLNQLLNHSWEESQFFLLQIQFARAGTESLRNHLRREMQELQGRRLQLRNRLSADAKLSLEDAQRYYGSWIYGAIRVAISIPDLRTKEALAKRLKLSMEQLIAALDFLLACGLVEQHGNEYRASPIYTHLGNDSGLIAQHHTNWRVRALSSFAQEGERDVHYSSVFSVSKSDALAIKAALVERIAEVQARVTPSEEETLFSFCLDWYEL